MSALRRLAQTNAAVSATPRGSGSANASGLPSPVTPVRGGGLPTTPRARLVYPPSPVTSPSRSAALPFDWEAVRRRGPPPYATPQLGRRVNRTNDVGTPGKTRVVRKKSLYERYALLAAYLHITAERSTGSPLSHRTSPSNGPSSRTISRCLHPRNLHGSLVAQCTSFICVCELRRFAEYPTPTWDGRTCIEKGRTNLGLTGYACLSRLLPCCSVHSLR